MAVSNSASQRRYIEAQAERRGAGNLRVVTGDMNAFQVSERFDRVVSVEMLEHMRNYRELFRRIAGWLEPHGRVFVHIFCHRAAPYAFVPRDESDWMSRSFFSGGMMPSDALPLSFPEHLRVVDRWRWSGRHYQRTADAWLANMDLRRDRIEPILESVYGAEAPLWWIRGNIVEEGGLLLTLAWGRATIIEVYAGFALFAAWIWHREPRSWVAGAWIVALCLIGNVVAGCYVVLAARACRGNASRFWHGPHGAAEERA